MGKKNTMTDKAIVASAQKTAAKIPPDECERLAISWDYEDDPRDDYMPDHRRYGRSEEDRKWRVAFREAITTRANLTQGN